MQRLVEQLLLLTRADEGAVARTRHDVDLDDLALDRGRAGCAATGSTSTRPVSDAGRVRGDRAALAQVVRNLVDNAARHADAAIASRCGRPATQSSWSSRTTVPAIPEDQRERVFERFVRLDEARARDAGGSGLGLAIVKEIVTAHGGTVAVSSVGAGRRPVRRTASCRGPPDAAYLNALSGAFRWASARSSQGGSTARVQQPERPLVMNTAKLRSKRIILPTIAAVAALGIGGVVWAVHRVSDDLAGQRARPRRHRRHRGRRWWQGRRASRPATTAARPTRSRSARPTAPRST